MQAWKAVATGCFALGLATSADAATIVFQNSFAVGGEIGFTSVYLPLYDGPGTIIAAELTFEGVTNQYHDKFSGDEPVTLPELPTSWVIGLEGPASDNQFLGEAVVNSIYPEFVVPAGDLEQHTRFTPFETVTISATDPRLHLYRGSGFNEFFVFGLPLTGGFAGAIQAGGTLTLTLTTTQVPEPATWALMLLGFGAAGAAFRSRRRAKAA